MAKAVVVGPDLLAMSLSNASVASALSGRARRPGVPHKQLNQRGTPGRRALPLEMPHCRSGRRRSRELFADPDLLAMSLSNASAAPGIFTGSGTSSST